MKNIRFRTRLIVSFSIIIILSLCVPAYYFLQTLEKDITTEARTNAYTQLDFVHWMLENNPTLTDHQALDAFCKTLSDQLHYRITVIAAGGKVIADSDVPFDTIASMDNHAGREEIISARSNGRGSSIRYSITLDRKLIYAAKNVNLKSAPSGVLRVATPLSTVESRLAHFNRQFWGMLLAIFILATLLSLLLARRLEQPIVKVMDGLCAIGKGDYGKQIDMDEGPEFASLSRGINEMSDKIRINFSQITEQKQELEAVLQGMAEGVMMLDKNGKIKAVNQALTQIAKCVPTCVGRRPMEVFLNPEIQTACNEVLLGDDAIHRKVSIQNNTAAGDTTYDVNLVKIPDGGAVVVFHNISELVRLEKVRQDFVANVSHELRTPLTSIKGYAETLLDEKFRASESSDHFVQTIIKNANQMSHIVNDLLELTKLQQNRKPFHELATVNGAACFRSAAETCMPILKEKNIKLDNQLSDFLPVLADENSLIQVFRNILDNAIRYSPPETVITAFAWKETDKQRNKDVYIFAIQDEGTGIPLRYQKRIFERFYRVNKERSREIGGTGLGLAICRNAVASMDGKIWLKSPPDKKTTGTVFFVSLYKAETG